MDDSIPASVVQDPSHVCPHCHCPGPHPVGPGTGPHTAKLVCRQCGRFLRWLSTKTPAERAAKAESFRRQTMAQQPATRLQRDYLAKLGYQGPPPQNKLEASDAIKAMLRQRGDQS